MRRALTYIVVATAFCPPCSAAKGPSWNQIQYIGGTIRIKTSRFDWNTTLTLDGGAIVVEIAPATVFIPKKTVRIKPSQVVSLSMGASAWRHVAAVDGAQLPSKPPALFGLLQDNGFLGIVYDDDAGKRAAILLDSHFSAAMLQVLMRITGKPVENSP